MTELELMKRYMYPYYQDATDEAYLTQMLADFGTPESAASMLWKQSATLFASGNVRSYGSGSTSTVFQSLKDAIEFCNSQAKLYDGLDKAKRRVGSIMVATEKTTFVGGASDEYPY